jgi:hypothetical protein
MAMIDAKVIDHGRWYQGAGLGLADAVVLGFGFAAVLGWVVPVLADLVVVLVVLALGFALVGAAAKAVEVARLRPRAARKARRANMTTSISIESGCEQQHAET